MTTPSEQMIGAPKIHSAMLKILAEVDAIGKNRRNQHQQFNFRGIDDVYNELHGLFAKHSVYTTSRILDSTSEVLVSKDKNQYWTKLKIEYRFWTHDGSFVTTEVVGEALDSGDKAGGKAMAYAHKYALLQAFCIPTEGDNDPDAQKLEPGHPPAQARPDVRQNPQRPTPPPAKLPQSPPFNKQNQSHLESLEEILSKNFPDLQAYLYSKVADEMHGKTKESLRKVVDEILAEQKVSENLPIPF